MKNLASLPLVLGTGFFLGLGVPLAKLAAIDGIQALSFTLWPTAVAGLVLMLLGWSKHGVARLNRRLPTFGLVAGVFGHALPMVAAYWLAAHAGAGFASLSFTLTPVLTLTIMVLLRREVLRPARLFAIVIGLGGGMLLVGGQVFSLQMDPVFVAVALAVPTLIAGTNVYRSLYMPRSIPDEWLSASTLLGSAVMLALITPWIAGSEVLAPTTNGATWMLAQAVALVVGYLFYFALQRNAEPVAFSLIGYVMMIISVCIGTLALGEPVAWTLWPAIALIAGALWLINANPAAASESPARAKG